MKNKKKDKLRGLGRNKRSRLVGFDVEKYFEAVGWAVCEIAEKLKRIIIKMKRNARYISALAFKNISAASRNIFLYILAGIRSAENRIEKKTETLLEKIGKAEKAVGVFVENNFIGGIERLRAKVKAAQNITLKMISRTAQKIIINFSGWIAAMKKSGRVFAKNSFSKIGATSKSITSRTKLFFEELRQREKVFRDRTITGARIFILRRRIARMEKKFGMRDAVRNFVERNQKSGKIIREKIYTKSQKFAGGFGAVLGSVTKKTSQMIRDAEKYISEISSVTAEAVRYALKVEGKLIVRAIHFSLDAEQKIRQAAKKYTKISAGFLLLAFATAMNKAKHIWVQVREEQKTLIKKIKIACLGFVENLAFLWKAFEISVENFRFENAESDSDLKKNEIAENQLDAFGELEMMAGQEEPAAGELIPLSEIAKESEYKKGYLVFMARTGKLKARKIEGIWMTTRAWLDEFTLEALAQKEKNRRELSERMGSGPTFQFQREPVPVRRTNLGIAMAFVLLLFFVTVANANFENMAILKNQAERKIIFLWNGYVEQGASHAKKINSEVAAVIENFKIGSGEIKKIAENIDSYRKMKWLQKNAGLNLAGGEEGKKQIAQNEAKGIVAGETSQVAQNGEFQDQTQSAVGNQVPVQKLSAEEVLAVLDHNLSYKNFAEHGIKRRNLNSNAVSAKKIADGSVKSADLAQNIEIRGSFTVQGDVVLQGPVELGSNSYQIDSSGTVTDGIWNGNRIDISDYTNLAVSGALLNLTGDTLSVNAGTLMDGKICTFVSGTGLVCTTDLGATVNYWSTSGNDIYNNNSGNVGIGTPTPGVYKLYVNGNTYSAGTLAASGALSASNFSGSSSGTNTGDQNLWATISSQSGSTSANLTADTLTINGGGIASTAISGDTLTITATEVDSKVGSLTQYYVPHWGTTALVNGTIYDNGTNVGIGTTGTGTYKLNVNGSTNATSYYVGGTALAMTASGTITGQTLYWDGSKWNPTTNLFSDSTKVGIGTTTPSQLFQVNNSGATAFVVTSGGNVGIGYTSPAYTLDVNGNIRVGTTAPNFGGNVLTVPATGTAVLGTGTNLYNAYWTGTNTLGSEQYVAMTRGGTGTTLTASAGGIVWTNGSTMQILSGTSTAGQMLQSGNVVTPSWSTATWPSAVGGAGTILRSNGTTGWAAAQTSYPDTVTSGYVLYASGTNAIGAEQYLNVTRGGTGAGTFTANYVMRGAGTGPLVSGVIYDNGTNVGIGTTNVGAAKLSVIGGNVGIGTSSPTQLLQVNASASNPIVLTSGGNIGIGTTSPTQLFQVNTSGTSAIVATSGGNVGIGTTSPGAMLDLGYVGRLGVIRLAGSTSGNVTIQVAAAAGTWAMTLPSAGNTNAGYQLTCVAADNITSWAAPGSLRIWKNITGTADPNDALTQILATSVYHFHYKPGMGTGDAVTDYVGVMADEAPWAMHYNGTIVNPVNTLGYMILGMQATNEKIANASQQITDLGTQSSQLDLKIDENISSTYDLQTAVNDKLNIVSNNFTSLASQVSSLNSQLASAQTKMDEDENNLATFESGINDTLSSILQTENMLTERVLDHETRIKALEDKMVLMTVSTSGSIPYNVVTQDKDGNATLAGLFKAKSIEANTGKFSEGIVAGEMDAKNITLGKDVSGKDTLNAGDASAKINTSQVTSDSKIYITPLGKLSGRSLYVDMEAVKKGESFTVKLDGDPLEKDIDFNWLVVN